MHLRNTCLVAASLLFSLAACGPAGTITGKVNVEGGTAGGIAVIVFGPQSAATVTKDDGSFTVSGLSDGQYVVRATLRGAEVEELSASTVVTQGKAAPEPALNFRLAVSKITGKVVFTDGSNAQDLTVNAVGPVTAGARTGPDGSFTFENLKSGSYSVSVEAPDTREGRVAIGVFASGPAMVGDLRLTPVGRVGGTVTYNAMPVANVTVLVPGTSISASTDSLGHFSLEGIPAGAQTLYARTGLAPFFQSATLMTQVARGSNPDVMITLTDDAPVTGTVTGTITFHGGRSPRDITVTAPGSGVTAMVGINGAYSLALPVGSWDIVASAPSHPLTDIARVEVSAGRVVTLPGRELSWYRPLWKSLTPLSVLTVASSTPADAVHNWSMVTIADATQQRLALVNVLTAEFRMLFIGGASIFRISRNAKYAAYAVNAPSGSDVFVYEIATGVQQVFHSQANVAVFEFSSDESVIFIQRAGPTLTRIAFATPNAPVTFPATGNATNIYAQSVDRWFVQETTDIRLVTPSATTPQVFTNVNQFSTVPTAWALTNCAATCQLRVLAPTATTNFQDVSVTPGPGTVASFAGQNQSRSDFPCFTQGLTAYCVRASDGQHFPLVAIPVQFKLNEAGSRVIFQFPAGGNTAIREEAFPPSPATTNLAASANGWRVGWMSETRAYAFEITGMARTLHLIRAGVDTVDTDIGTTQTIFEAAPMLVVPQASASKWRGVLGDGAMRNIDVATTIPILATSVRSLGNGPITKFGAVSFDVGRMFILDENAGMVRVFQGSFPGGAGDRSAGLAEFFLSPRLAPAQVGLYVFNSNAMIEVFDDIAPNNFIGQSTSLRGIIGLSADSFTIALGVVN